MKKLLFLSTLIMAFGAYAEAKKEKQLTEKDMGAYLFTYFNDPTHALFMAISYDGYTFTAVNNGEPIISGDSIADQRGIRDPHIYRAPIPSQISGVFVTLISTVHLMGNSILP